MRLLDEVDQLWAQADALLTDARGALDCVDNDALSAWDAPDGRAGAPAHADALIRRASHMIGVARATREEAHALIREAHCIRRGQCGCELCAELVAR
jgi:hypothetical protein